MGGDGGTLNNSRREHVRLRNRILGTSSDAARSLASRASVSDCALSKARLSPPHVVVDRAGNLYNKEALLAYILARRTRENASTPDPLEHIRSMKRDTTAVCFLPGESQLMCPVTRKVVFEEGRFSVGWNCGCVTAPVQDVVGIVGTDEEGDERCIACDRKGIRVRLGAKLADRQKILEELRDKESSRKRKKKRKASEDNLVKAVPNDVARDTEPSRAGSPTRKIPRLASSTG